MTTMAIIAALIFVAVYGIIITDKLDRTVVALSGAALMIIIGILSNNCSCFCIP